MSSPLPDVRTLSLGSIPSQVLSTDRVLPPAGSVKSETVVMVDQDSVFPDFFIMHYAYFFEKPNESMSTPNLKNALSLVLSAYPILMGWQKRDATGRATVNIDAANLRPVEFIEASTNISLKDLNLHTESNLLNFPFIPCMAPPKLQLSRLPNMSALADEPMIALRVTRFGCGGLAIGLMMSHLVSDGEGWAKFVNNWAAVTRVLAAGKQVLVPITAEQVPGWLQPHHSREFLRLTAEDLSEATAAADAALPANRLGTREFVALTGPPPPATEPLGASIIRFSAEELKAMKQAAAPPAPGYTTTFEALSTHLFLETAKVRKLAAKDGPMKLSFVSNGRRRHQPNCDPAWFGNFAWHSCCDEMTPDQVSKLTLKESTAILHEEIQSKIGVDRLSFVRRHLAKQPHINGVFFNMNGTRDLALNSWQRFGLFECDFGAGKPIKIVPPFYMPVEGLALIVPAEAPKDEKSEVGLDVYLFMKQRELDELNANPEFRKYRPAAPCACAAVQPI